MTRSRLRSVGLPIGGATATAAILLSAGPAAAADTTSAVFPDPIQLLNSFALLLLFGTFVIVTVVVYLIATDRNYYRVVAQLIKRGESSSPSDVSATVAAVAGINDEAVEDLHLSGPSQVEIGKPATYKAMTGTTAADGATWAIDPVTSGAVTPPTGAEVQLVAIKAGDIKVSATVGAQVVSLTVKAIEVKSGRSTTLPFVGVGWGTVVVSILVSTLVATLGVAGVLDGQAIAGFYGALVGYLFGARPSGGGAATGGATPASGQMSGSSPGGTGTP